MKRDTVIKWLIVLAVIVFAVLTDQITKYYANMHLASPHYPDHTVSKIVEPGIENLTLDEYVAQTYPNFDENNRAIALNAYTSVNQTPAGRSTLVKSGDTIDFGYKMHRVNAWWDYKYARNTGAAWSLFADSDPLFRKIFFSATSLLALIMLCYFIYVTPRQKSVLILTLATVMGGAIGNIIDRIRLGYVIDFISWHYGIHAWPTFNIADAYITVGVVLLCFLMLWSPKPRKNKDDSKIYVSSVDNPAVSRENAEKQSS